MPDCVPFRLYVGDDILQIVPLLLGEINRRGGSTSGSTGAGTISIATPLGAVRGSFRVDGKSLAVEISTRPSAISCGALESKLQDHILDAKTTLRNARK